MKKNQKYEYKCVAIVGFGDQATRVLNEHAREGWELVCVYAVWHYLKREISLCRPSK